MVKKGMLYFSAILVLLSPLCLCKDLGTFGAVYPIAEENFLTVIERQLHRLTASGALQILQHAWQKKAAAYFDRPAAVPLLPSTTHPKQWWFDPSIVLHQALINAEGTVLVPKGTRVNPLTTHRLSNTLIFLNGDDPEQLQWAAGLNGRLKGRDKIILVGGSVLEAQKRLNKAVYFDQGGRLIRHFGLTYVPAWITQRGNRLQITEVKDD